MADRQEMFRDASDRSLASVVVTRVDAEVENDVTARTAATRLNGAHNFLEALMRKEFDLSSDYDRAALGETVGRIVANAERQGITMPHREPGERPSGFMDVPTGFDYDNPQPPPEMNTETARKLKEIDDFQRRSQAKHSSAIYY